MFDREIIEELDRWAKRSNRKPLILRGARQVGKTTAVEIFSKKFEQYIYLNLDIRSESRIFQRGYDIDQLVQAIFLEKNKAISSGKLLIFIDEIQNSPEAVSMLRYFYESKSTRYYHVIAAGSLLESLISKNINIPVGRVEYLYMKPLNFREYLNAIENIPSLDILKQMPFPDFAHEKLLKDFYQYTLIGGMPEVVKTYKKDRDIAGLRTVYESLLTSYLDDVEKYARNNTIANVIRHAIENSFYSAAKRISFEGFGHSKYRSREMSEALKIIEKAMLIYLMYPTTAVNIPIEPDNKKSPRLHILDTGLINYFAGLQKELFGTRDLDSFCEGKIAEHIVGQELMAESQSIIKKVGFWVREKKQSSAQVDYVIPFNDYLIPIEVKKGKAGRLRSLHEYIDRAPHNYAVRVYSGKLSIDTVKTIRGKKYFLLNLPFYLVGKINDYLDWFLQKI
jgi:uncharacterized protein